MKTIYKDEYHDSDGVFINLEHIPYENFLNKICTLDKTQKYYVYCKGGVKSRRVAMALEQCGYAVVRVINR